MAKRRASTANAGTAVAPRGTSANDRTLYTHNLWLNYLKPVSLGLVFSPNALRAAQVELPLQSADAQHALEALSISKPLSRRRRRRPRESAAHPRSTRDFLTEFLGWKPDLLDFFRPSCPGPDVRRPGDRPGPARPTNVPNRPTSCGMT